MQRKGDLVEIELFFVSNLLNFKIVLLKMTVEEELEVRKRRRKSDLGVRSELLEGLLITCRFL